MYRRLIGILLIAGCMVACRSNKKDVADLIYFQNLHDSLNVQVLVGNGYKILNTKVKDGKLLVCSSKMGEDFSVLHLIDLSNKQVVARKELKTLRYYEVLSDFDDHRFVYCSIYDGSKVFFYDFRNDLETVLTVEHSSWVEAGDIVLQNNSLYYIRSVYGPYLWNIKEDKLHTYDQHRDTRNPQLSNISYPLDTNLAVLSREQSGRDSLKLYAVDASGSEKWTAVTECRDGASLFVPEMIMTEDAVIVNSGRQLVKLNKQNGATLATRKFDDLISSVFHLKSEIVVFSVHRGVAFPDEKTKSKVLVNGLRTDSLSDGWSASFDVTGMPQFGLINGRLFLSDHDSIRAIDAYNGRTGQNGPGKESYTKMLTDTHTGKYYLLLNDEIMIW
ncbi:hypothetical protein [Chitinophaga sp. S165]|uniref:hypothetical protein n=1 Tax=Chitinophaga sp. S165 TaxID=2135462 RepID=UPI000D70D4CB|nr:hypothetical protein [Chitinophaga sp. S165]PWV56170.1 hypothetical protein C7475_101684 [Chitinophaga sp. S165]